MRETILLILCVLALSMIGQTLMKKGVGRLGAIAFGDLLRDPLQTVWKMLTSPLIVGGLALAAVGAFLWLLVLSRADLSYALPLLGGLAYVVVVFTSWVFLREQVTLPRLVGVLLISAGVFLLTR